MYRTLADQCSATPADSPNSWHELHYRCLAQDYGEAVQLATPSYFRTQFIAFRPLGAIREDIDAALLASAETRDAVSLTRLLLAGAEFQQRDYHLEDTSIGLLLLTLGKHEHATAHMRDGNHLQTSAGSALEFSWELLKRGSSEEARRIFDLAEPLPFLSGATALDDSAFRNNADDLYVWAEVAPFFMDVGNVLQSIDRVQVESVPAWNMTAEEATRVVRRRMHFHLGYGVLDKEDWNGLDKVLEGFDLQDRNDLSDWYSLVIRIVMNRARVGDVAKARSYLGRVLDVVDPATRDEEERVLVAEWVFRVFRDVEETQRWLAGIGQPEVQKEVSSESGFAPFKLRFRLNRLLYALGSDARVTSLVPDSDESKLRLTVLFERAVCKIAWIWGKSWRQDTMTTFEVEREVRPLLRCLNRNSTEQEDWLHSSAIRGLRKDLFTRLIRAVACHGPDAVFAMRDAMVREWDAPSTEASWPPELIRALTLVLRAHGVDTTWAANRLNAIEPSMLSGADVDGRIHGYHAQAEAWQQLDCQDEADRCLTSMLQSSFGVGYRKDYQLDTWIQWAGRIIEDEPARAVDVIGWFASAIRELDEMAEGGAAASACRELVRVAFQWSPRRAVQLFFWLTENGLMSYPDGFHDLLRMTLETDRPPTKVILPTYNFLYQTISRGGASDIASLVVQKTASQTGRDDAARSARDMLASMERFGSPSANSNIRHAIAKALQSVGIMLSACGLAEAALITEDVDVPHGSKLQLDDGELATHEVLARVRCVDDIEALLEREDRASSFDWAPVVREVVANTARADLVRLASRFAHKLRNIDVLCAVADRAHALGSNDLAWKVGLQALNCSDHYGWDPHMDGGSRITAFETLVGIKPAEGRELAYRRLVQDVVENFRYPASVVLHLDRILPLLADQLPLREAWAEIETYLHTLFDDVQGAPEDADFLTTAPENDTVESAIADLLASHLDHPATAIARAAQRALGACLHEGVSTVDRIVVESLEGGEPQQESVLMVLDAVSQTDTSLVSRFSDHVQPLTASPNFCVRLTAETICSRLGVNVASFLPPTKPLSPVYELALPSHTSIYTPSVQEVSRHRPMGDSNKPHEILRPFNHNLRIIAEFVGLDPENLYYRAAQIMRELESHEAWDSQAELLLRSNMDSTDLAFSFRRPRSVVARRAMFHVVAELVDAGRLNRDKVSQLDFVLRTYDPAMVLMEPSPRPTAIAPIIVPNKWHVGCSEWVDGVADAFESLPVEHADGRIVVAEQTLLKCLERSHPEERRQSLVCDADTVHEEPGEEGLGFFCRVNQRWVSEYGSIGVGSWPPPIVIRHVGYGYDSPADTWLALNPTIAQQLGWIPSPKGLFAWVNLDAVVMVESCWWVDGVLAQNWTTASTEEVGEGWLVLASKEALDQLRCMFPAMTRRQRVERQYHADAKTAPTRSLIRETSL